MNSDAVRPPPRPDPQERARTIVAVVVGASVLAFLGSFGVWVLALPVDGVLYVGLGLYYLGLFSAVGYWLWSPLDLFDARATRIGALAAGYLFVAVAVVALVAVPAELVAHTLGTAVLPTPLSHAAYAYFVLVLVYPLVHGFVDLFDS